MVLLLLPIRPVALYALNKFLEIGIVAVVHCGSKVDRLCIVSVILSLVLSHSWQILLNMRFVSCLYYHSCTNLLRTTTFSILGDIVICTTVSVMILDKHDAAWVFLPSLCHVEGLLSWSTS